MPDPLSAGLMTMCTPRYKFLSACRSRRVRLSRIFVSLAVLMSCSIVSMYMSIDHFRVLFRLASKRVFVQNRSYENVFFLRFHFHANQTNFHMESFVPTM